MSKGIVKRQKIPKIYIRTRYMGDSYGTSYGGDVYIGNKAITNLSWYLACWPTKKDAEYDLGKIVKKIKPIVEKSIKQSGKVDLSKLPSYDGREKLFTRTFQYRERIGKPYR